MLLLRGARPTLSHFPKLTVYNSAFRTRATLPLQAEMPRTRKFGSAASSESTADRPSKKRKLDTDTEGTGNLPLNPLPRPGIFLCNLEPESSTRPSGKGKEKAIEAEPLSNPERIRSLWKVGAHVSAAGGVENSILNAVAIGWVFFLSYVMYALTYAFHSIAQMLTRCSSNRRENGHLLPSRIRPYQPSKSVSENITTTLNTSCLMEVIWSIWAIRTSARYSSTIVRDDVESDLQWQTSKVVWLLFRWPEEMWAIRTCTI